MNCCRKYLEYDPDYTRQLTPDNTRDEDEEERYYSDEMTTEEDEDEDMEDEEDEDDDMDEEEEREDDNTDDSLDPDDDELDSEGTRTLGLPPTDTEQSSESERAATPGVSKEVGKLSLDDDQLTEHETGGEDEVQIVGEVQYQSDDEQPKARKNRKPTQRRN